MKILMFGWEFPPHISGGLGTACYGLTKGLSKIPGLEVLFVVPKSFGDENQQAVELLGANQIPVKITQIERELKFSKKLHYIEAGSNLVPYTTPEEYFNLSQKKLKGKNIYIETNAEGCIPFSGKYGANLYQEIYNYGLVAAQIAKNYEFDVIHAHDWLTYPAGMAAKQVSGKPLVVHVHATDFDRSGGSVNPSVYRIEKEGLDAADAIITVSNLTRNIVINNYKIKPTKVTTVYNAVEPVHNGHQNHIGKADNEKVVTFLGRITMQKGPEYFIEAANKVLKNMDNVRFVMAGSGDMMDKMVERAASLGIMDKFHFTGFLKGEDVFKMFAHSDLYIMPSVSEPFGISPLEAMQTGVPVIISKQSGVSEILKHAIKIDFWDIDKMANAIYAILNYPALSKTIIENGWEEANNLRWDESAQQVHEVYQTVLSKT
ncbi:MAG TPA: 4-alpha-glucanotransferase [Marinilabiliales bacterium]|nr:MAG: 4-alpha-glucanotransferase [Bacteroidetes bacterium GWA2_40_14]OFX56828.1 MAG: 4-alpha-glucanotransferase [Bacteroidetes bacterium GWC2_40_13]OFX76040.1 MAG: 4-alpha-glucanotransferase [Bacteroidetes bacterium GWD2_40_43]OFX94346.1 MAG: 4-alpha-glucanotransferase [Bacteroidetes bacterium GWE2_40_63]OFY18824.1 MAG: 4-alpha-glucanotransferase [Bacteroidetes bacterium GWF2_40_13]OFZ24800.1 MAG: 4-alpha-glucanotransferase [Bacteroidetes bacterium RIFOXYC2_FULL_40_12]HAM99407.1 4-alpha-glu